MSEKPGSIMPLPVGKVLQKGMALLKQVLWSMAVVMIAAGILAGMVIYTVSVMRAAQLRILSGDLTVITQSDLRQ